MGLKNSYHRSVFMERFSTSKSMQECFPYTVQKRTAWVCCRLHFLGCRGVLKHLHKDEITLDTFSDPSPDLKELYPAAQPYLNPATPFARGWATRRLASLPLYPLYTLLSTPVFLWVLFSFSHIDPFTVPRFPPRRGGGEVSEGGARAQSSQSSAEDREPGN